MSQVIEEQRALVADINVQDVLAYLVLLFISVNVLDHLSLDILAGLQIQMREGLEKFIGEDIFDSLLGDLGVPRAEKAEAGGFQLL